MLIGPRPTGRAGCTHTPVLPSLPPKKPPITDEELFVLSRQWLADKIADGVPIEEKFIPWEPHPKQRLLLNIEDDDEFLRDDGTRQQVIECLFGGATGGAKTVALLMAALKYVHVPGYSALLLRRNYPDMKQEGGLINLAHEWLASTSARWNDNDKTYTFPSGATVRFGHMNSENDKFQYQGGEYHFVGFDELTQFTETQYKYLFSRMRKRKGLGSLPLRMLSATNPGGIGGQWVYERFIPEDFKPAEATALQVWYKEQPNGMISAFIPSMLEDNPSLDRESYLESLMGLDEITRQQYLNGDWQIQIRGDILYTYSEPHTVISWSQFERVFGERSIPTHWRLGVFLDVGTTEGHPNVTSWFATAAENSPVVDGVKTAGMVFLYRGHMTTQTTARDVSKVISAAMRREKSQCLHWEMSHEASSERLEFNKQGLPFKPWKTGRTRGIEQLKNSFQLVNNHLPNPFRPDLKGHPQLFLVVDDEELIHAKTDRGLARWRAEILAYHWNQPKSGEPATRLVPYPLFNDAVDTMRAAAAQYWPHVTQKSMEERVVEAVERKQPLAFVESVEDPVYRAHLLSQRGLLAEMEREKLQQQHGTAVSDWSGIG